MGEGRGDRADRAPWWRASSFIPPGTLAGVPLSVRVAALAIGFLAFLLIRRSAFAGVLVGEAVLITGALAFGS